MGEHTRFCAEQQLQRRLGLRNKLRCFFSPYELEKLSPRLFGDMLPHVSVSVSRANNQFFREKSGKMFDPVTFLNWERRMENLRQAQNLFWLHASKKWTRLVGHIWGTRERTTDSGLGFFSEATVGPPPIWLVVGLGPLCLTNLFYLPSLESSENGCLDLEKCCRSSFSGFSRLDCRQ